MATPTGLDLLLSKAHEQAVQTNEIANSVRGLAEVDSGRYLPTGLAIQKTLEAASLKNSSFPNFGEFAKTIKTMANPNTAQADTLVRHKGYFERWNNEVKDRQKANGPSGIAETFQGADGGFLVPPEFAAQILMRTYANDLMSRCTVFPLGSNSIKIPAINETSRVDGARFGGVQAYWRQEAASVTATKPGLMTVDLTLDSLMLMIRTTQEILEDTGGVLEILLTTIAAQEYAFKLGDSIVNGDGVGKPLGINVSKNPSRITLAAEDGQAAATIVARNIMKMWSRLHISCWPNAVWLFDVSILPQLMSMTVGTAGANMVVWLPPGGLSSAPYGSLMGRPMIPIEFCQQLGTEGDLILTDLTQYLVGTKGGVSTAVSMHLYFDTNEMAFRFTMRMDGKPWWIAPLTPKNSGPTQGPTVTLATRS